MISFDEAKQQVAEESGYSTWLHLRRDMLENTRDRQIEDRIRFYDMLDGYYEKVLELYARNLANEKVKEYKIFSLPSQQSFIFGHITNEFKSTGEISQNTGLLSKNVSVQLHNIMSVGGLIEMKQEGKLKYWKLL